MRKRKKRGEINARPQVSVVGVLQRGRSVGGGGPFKLSPTRNPEKPDPPGPTVAGGVDHIIVPKGQRVESRVFSLLKDTCRRSPIIYPCTYYNKRRIRAWTGSTRVLPTPSLIISEALGAPIRA